MVISESGGGELSSRAVSFGRELWTPGVKMALFYVGSCLRGQRFEHPRETRGLLTRGLVEQ